MLIDNHVHIGPFKDGMMFEPEDVAANMLRIGVTRWIYFSTAFPCVADNYIEWYHECVQRMDVASSGRGIPFLWMNGKMLRNSDCYYDSMFRGIKIHEGCDVLSDRERECAFALAAENNVPLVIHTGEQAHCKAGQYEKLIAGYENVLVILAHGRPLKQALSLLRKYPKVMLDSAFMSLEQMKAVATADFIDRIFFGSDYPVQQYFYPRHDLMTMWRTHYEMMKSIFGKHTVERLIIDNLYSQ